VVVSYFRAGMLTNEKCVFIGQESDFSKIHKTLVSLRVEGYPHNKKIDYIDSNLYLVAAKKQDPGWLCEKWKNMLEGYLDKGYSVIRAVGALPKELTLTAEIQSFLLEYEKAIRPLFESYPVSGLCLYPYKYRKTPFGHKLSRERCHPVFVPSLHP